MGGPLRFWHRISRGNCILRDGIAWVLLVGIYVLFWKFSCTVQWDLWWMREAQLSEIFWANKLRLLIHQPLADMESGAPYNHSSWYPNLSIMVCSQKEHIQVKLFPFCNPTHKTESETANRWETTNSKPPVPIIMVGWS